MLRRRTAGLETTGMLALALLLILGWTTGVRASGVPSCEDPDGIDPDAPCCEEVTPTLPDIPAIDDPMRYFTWNRCSVARNKEICGSFGAPVEQTGECGVYTLPFTVQTCGKGQNVLFSGDLNAIYMRTFLEGESGQKGGGNQVQVWRFLLNGDLELSQFLIDRFGDNPNIPQSYRDFGNQVFWSGYIDYRLTCDKGLFWEIEWVLNHDCDRFAHPANGDRPGTYNPVRSFGMATDSFIPFNETLGSSDLFDLTLNNGLREVDYTSGTTSICTQPSRVDMGGVAFVNESCACAEGENLPTPYSDIQLAAESICGAEIVPSKTGPLVAKFAGGFEIGKDPFVRVVAILMGESQWAASCEKSIDADYFEGVMVLTDPSRYVFSTFTTGKAGTEPIPPFFIDVANSIDSARTRRQGVPHVADRIVNVNFFDD